MGNKARMTSPGSAIRSAMAVSFLLWLMTGSLSIAGTGAEVGEAESAPPAATATAPVAGKSFRDSVTGMEFVLVKGGCFRMGDSFGGGDRDELPPHEVCVDDFYMGRYEVTQGEWLKVMGNNPAHFNKCGARCPVESITLRDVDRFMQKLNKLSGRHYRLPHEAEWEFAARSRGRKEKWAGTSNEQGLKGYAVYLANSAGKTRPVGKKRPNGLGLYDMSGNVWEWVEDFYDGKYYSHSPRLNPTGPGAGTSYVQRGGSWSNQPFDLRTMRRVRGKEGNASINTGFRVVLPVK